MWWALVHWIGQMAFTADAVANRILQIAESSGHRLTNMELQKHVFFAHAWHLGIDGTGVPLISEPIEAWKYGPVIRTVWREFHDYGKQPIDRRARAKELRYVTGRVEEYEPSLEDEAPGSGIALGYAEQLISWVWQRYSVYDGIELSALTHAEGEPWRIVRDQYKGNIPLGLHIPNALIRDRFRQKLRLLQEGQQQL